MDFHEMYNELTLKYIIECRRCGGSGGSGVSGGNPCGVCLGSGIEGVTATDAIVEQRVLDGDRFFAVNGIELNELEV